MSLEIKYIIVKILAFLIAQEKKKKNLMTKLKCNGSTKTLLCGTTGKTEIALV